MKVSWDQESWPVCRWVPSVYCLSEDMANCDDDSHISSQILWYVLLYTVLLGLSLLPFLMSTMRLSFIRWLTQSHTIIKWQGLAVPCPSQTSENMGCGHASLDGRKRGREGKRVGGREDRSRGEDPIAFTFRKRTISLSVWGRGQGADRWN